jgi:hypothetical protein
MAKKIKRIVLHVRISAKEKSQIEYNAERDGRTVSDYIRRRALHPELKSEMDSYGQRAVQTLKLKHDIEMYLAKELPKEAVQLLSTYLDEEYNFIMDTFRRLGRKDEK